MTIIKGIELDLLRSSNNDFNWELVFTEGSFLSVNTSIQLEPSLIRLNKRDYTHCDKFPCLYNIYYNPYYDKYSIIDQNESQDECNDNGYKIGGFQVKNCKMFFVYPNNCDGVQYERNFTPEYNNSFTLTEFDCTDTICGDFNDISFSEAYNTKCVIGEETGATGCNTGGFAQYTFNSDFNNTDCPTQNNFNSDFDNGYLNGGSSPSPVPPITPVPPIRSFDLGFDSGFGL